MKKGILYTLCAFFLGLTAGADEGMYPLSSLKNIDLSKAGLKISPNELYNPNGVSLIDAIVRLGGCTGSFISADGLIITNHHCAFGSVAAISDTFNNYIEKGFLAKNREMEVPAQGLTVKITVGYQDVSERVLEEASKVSEPASRLKLIQAKMNELVEAAKTADPSKVYEISEMFQGKTYVMFAYKIIKDIRLVYVPQRNIGEYGGEADNWVWPRHSGDFAFVRAYVAPDGSPAAYSKENVPFSPSKFLRVSAEGVRENDFIFVLGYPGRTYRHQPAKFFEFHQNELLPFISRIYNWKIAKMTELGKNNPDLAIKYSSQIKSLANTAKNFEGKLQGFRRIPLVKQKIAEEEAIKTYIKQHPELSDKYGHVLEDIQAIYSEREKYNELYLWLSQLFNSNGIMRVSYMIYKYQQEMKSVEESKKKALWASNAKAIKKQIGDAYGMYNPDFDKAFVGMMLQYALKKPQFGILQNISEIKMAEDPYVACVTYAAKMVTTSYLNSPQHIFNILDKKPTRILKLQDELLRFSDGLSKVYEELDIRRQKEDAALNALMAKLLEVKMLMSPSAFIPDANATLRFTYGYIRGYKPNDGEYHKPFTTLKGIIEKADNNVYILPDQYRQFEEGKLFEGFESKELGDLPVDFLYNLDTTGGNSGSPVLNANGQLVGVNFDRAYTATINDYAWNENYSRSVAVDIRYVLWVTGKVAGADFLLKEMGVR